MKTFTLPFPPSVERLRATITALLLIIAFTWAGTLKAAQVDENTAREIAIRVLQERSASFTTTRGSDLQLVYTKSGIAVGGATELVYFRVFNATGGFVIVSGEDLVVPVLGYSTDGAFPSGELAENVAKWLEGYAGEIRDVIEANTPAVQEVVLAWQ